MSFWDSPKSSSPSANKSGPLVSPLKPKHDNSSQGATGSAGAGNRGQLCADGAKASPIFTASSCARLSSGRNGQSSSANRNPGRAREKQVDAVSIGGPRAVAGPSIVAQPDPTDAARKCGTPGSHLICFNNFPDLDESDEDGEPAIKRQCNGLPAAVEPQLKELDPLIFGLEQVNPGLEMLADGQPLVLGLNEEQKKGARLILGVLPDLDPEAVVGRMRLGLSADAIADEMAGSACYPKFRFQKPDLPVEVLVGDATVGQDGKFSVKELLRRYPDPETAFMDMQNRSVASTLYIWESTKQLTRLFPSILVYELYSIMRRNKMFFLPVAVELEKVVERNAAVLDANKQHLRPEFFVSRRARTPAGVDHRYLAIFRQNAPEQLPPLEITDEMLFWEYNFYMNKKKIDESLRRADKRKNEFEANMGPLTECECCFVARLPQLMVFCQAFQHSFCKDCVKKHAAVLFEQGKCVVNCIYGSCESSYSVQVLRRLMEPQMFEALEDRLTHFEVKQAGLEDLVACPFCDFLVMMPNAADKVVKCLNAACHRDSCRLCKQPEHLPFKCGELDATETGLRAFVENKMAEAMMCICANLLCKKNTKYGLHSSDPEIRDRRALEAGEAAMTEHLAKHPGLLQAMGGRRLDVVAMVEDLKNRCLK